MLKAVLALLSVPLLAQQATPPCEACAEWNRPQAPFQIFANTYYVGPRGLSAILITSGQGHVLIDGALPESAAAIAASVRALGFKVEEIRLIVNSHVHFDHAGGIAALQRMSGATVAATASVASVLTSGVVPPSDPQSGVAPPIATVREVRTVSDGETLRVGPLTMPRPDSRAHAGRHRLDVAVLLRR